MNAATRPLVEIARKQPDGSWRIYAAFYTRPLCLYVLGRWIIGRRHVRRAERAASR